MVYCFFFFKQKTAYEMRISDWSSDVCSSDLEQRRALMLPQELMQLPEDDILVIRGGIPVIRGKKIRYFKDAVFRSRLTPAPKVPALPKPIAPIATIDDLRDEQLAAFNAYSALADDQRSDDPKSELHSLTRISYDFFSLPQQHTT